MSDLLSATKNNTEYLNHYGTVVEMWECKWKKMRTSPDVKHILDSKFPNRNAKWEMTQQKVLENSVEGNLFGIVECDISVPEHLRSYFAEMQPIFKNANISRDDIGEFMYCYAVQHEILKKPRRLLIASFYGEKIVLATPLLQWYLKHGLVVSHIYQSIQYDPSPCFASFADTVSDARREGDVHPDKTIIADTMKLVGNSAYGKCATEKTKHRDVVFCNEEVASRGINSHRFRQLEPVAESVYQLTLSIKSIKFDLPLQIAFMVYQYAKLRMLQFYYDFLDFYIERPLFQYCEMDTDSAYLALARSSLDECISTDKREHFYRHRAEWFPGVCCDAHASEYVACRLAGKEWTIVHPCCMERARHDKRTPGLFKVEWEGKDWRKKKVGLCSKTYYCLL